MPALFVPVTLTRMYVPIWVFVSANVDVVAELMSLTPVEQSELVHCCHW